MKKALILMMKNKCREQLKFWRSNFLFVIVIIVSFIVFVNFFPLITSILSEHLFYFNFSILTFLMVIYLIRKYPPILINPATIHFLAWNSKALKTVVALKFIFLIIIFVFSASILTLLSHEVFNVAYFFHLLILLITLSLLSWRNYHYPTFKRYSFLIFILLSIPFMLSFSISGIIISLLVSIWSLCTPLKQNTLKLLSDMTYTYKANSASARADHVEMLTIIAQKELNHEPFLSFPNTTKYPIIAKSIIIDGFRIPIAGWIIRAFIVVGSIILYNTPLNLGFNLILFIMMFSLFIQSFTKESVQNVLSLQAKSNLGLLIPYTKKELATYYTIYPIGVTIILFLILMIFTPISVLTISGVFVMYCINTYLWHFLALKHLKQHKKIDFIFGTILTLILSGLALL